MTRFRPESGWGPIKRLKSTSGARRPKIDDGIVGASLAKATARSAYTAEHLSDEHDMLMMIETDAGPSTLTIFRDIVGVDGDFESSPDHCLFAATGDVGCADFLTAGK